MAETLTVLAVGQAAAAATATTAATAATAGLIGVGGQVTAMGLISGIGTVLSAGSAIMGGLSNAASLREQAQYEDMRARQELIMGRQEEVEVLKRSNQALARTIARAGAAGLDLEGSPSDTARDINKEADLQLATSRDATQVAMLTRTMNATRLRRRAGSAAFGGFMGGLTSLASGLA